MSGQRTLGGVRVVPVSDLVRSETGTFAHSTTAQLWIEACDRLGLPYDQQQLGRWDLCRVWDEIDRIRRDRDGGSVA